MTELVTVLVAVVITAVVASSITSMSLAPIKTQRQKSNYATAEGLSIAIRKGVVEDAIKNPTTSVFVQDAGITDANVKAASFYKDLQVSGDSSCDVKTNYQPYGTGVVVPYAVECKVGKNTDRQQAVAWQPLYTTTNFNEQVGAGTTSLSINTCLNKWLNDPSASVAYSKSATSVEVNLASSYPSDCPGRTKLTINEFKEWDANSTNPCKIEDVKQDGTFKVKFKPNNDSC